MSVINPKQHTLELLRAMLDARADFRPGQWEAIEAVRFTGSAHLSSSARDGAKAWFIFLLQSYYANKTQDRLS
jgi:hypothetical protein